jgi:sigma-B regulation protein RsbU (phosphoserine phosphatase)
MSAEQVLSAFHRDGPYLFLGAAFVAVGVVSIAFGVIRRRVDLLLVYFALFAALYGARLWVQSTLLGLTFQGSVFFDRLRSAIDYIILVPAFLFFGSFDVPALFDRRVITYTGVAIGAGLTVATFAAGQAAVFRTINSVTVILAMLLFLISWFRSGVEQTADRTDFVLLRWGMLSFVAVVFWDNLKGAFSLSSRSIEPFGFAVLLGSLGCVAARRSLRRDQQLNEIQKELDVARNIQLSILPSEFPASSHFRVAAGYAPMAAVAGDFYDYVVMDDREAGLLVADVSGHGVPAALIASMVKLAAVSQRAVAGDPSRVLAGMNAALLGNTQDQFVTAAYVYHITEARELR